MSDVVVAVTESVTNVSVTETSVDVAVVETPVQITVGTSGPQGAVGAGFPTGGTAGQVLAKNSSTDYDTSWIDNYNTVIQQYVKNDGTALTKGKAVYISSANGTNIIVSAASNTSEATSSKTLGLLMQDLAINAQGWVITEGKLSGLDTSAATAGDPVWLGVSGALIYGLANKPVAPAHLVYIGVVSRAHAIQGEILVKVQNGFELDELHNVLITSPVNGQVVSYDSASGLWKNTALPGTVAYATSAGSATVAGSALTAGTASYAATTGSVGTANYATNAGYATTAGTATYASSAGVASSATSASTATVAGTAFYASSAGSASNAGTASYAVSAGTASYGTLAGTATFATTSGTATYASAAGSATTAGVADSATLAGTATYSTTSGTAVYGTTSGTAVYATSSGTAVSISGSITESQVTNLTTDLAGKASLASANAFTVGGHSITNNSDVTALNLKANGTQTAPIFGVNSSASSPYFTVTASGAVKVGTSSVSGIFAATNTLNTSSPVIVAKGNVSQSGNLTEWQDSTGTVLASIASTGVATLPSASGSIVIGQTANNTPLMTVTGYSDSADGSLAAIRVINKNYSASTPQVAIGGATGILVSPKGSGFIGAVVKGAASQSANLQEWQNSAGTVLASISAFGVGTFGQTVINAVSNTVVPLYVQAFASTTKDSSQYVASGGTVLGGRNANAQIYTGSTAPLTTAVGGATTAASGTGTVATITTTSAHNLAVGDRVTVAGVTPTGYNGTYIVTAVTSTTFSYANATTGAQTVAGTVSVDNQVSIVSRSAATTPVVIRGAASQSSNMLEWRDSSNGALGYMGPAGAFYTVNYNTINSYATLVEENSGGRLRLQKMTSSAANPGANLLKLYVVAGTNANTLKLVVRAGAAGAETTILDNIPT